MRITASFPIMFWRKGFVLLLSLHAKIHPSDWQDLQMGHSLSSASQNRWSIPKFNETMCLCSLFYNFSRKFPLYSLKEPFQCLTTFTIWRFFLLFSLSPFLLIQLLRVWEGPITIQSSITVSEMVGSPSHQKTCWFSSTVCPSLNICVMLGKSLNLSMPQFPTCSAGLSEPWFPPMLKAVSSLTKGGHQLLDDLVDIYCRTML